MSTPGSLDSHDLLCLQLLCLLEKAMAPHSSTLAWKIAWMEEPGRLQSMGSQRVGHNWATSLSVFNFVSLRRKWQHTPSVLAWRITGTGEPGGLPSMGSHRVGHNWSDLAAAAACVYISYILTPCTNNPLFSLHNKSASTKRPWDWSWIFGGDNEVILCWG